MRILKKAHTIAKRNYTKFRHFTKRHKHLVTPAALIGGFIADIFTFNRVDSMFDNALLIVHFLLVGSMLALRFTQPTKFGEKYNIAKHRAIITVVMMFSLGALFSAFTVLYTRSSSLLTSWIFVVGVLGIMLGTEFSKRYSNRLLVQMGALYTALFTYLIFLVPLLLNRMGAGMFIVSGALSLVIIGWYIAVLRRINRIMVKRKLRYMIGIIVIVFATLNGFYFAGIIPPIPLALKDAGVYHNFVWHSTSKYTAAYEPTPKIVFWRKESRTIHKNPTEPIHFFGAVFAPAKIKTTIVHRWDHFEPEMGKWVTRDTISIPIIGGRAQGYRGFSTKTALDEGTWRVVVTTKRNQRLGQVRFRVKHERMPRGLAPITL